MFKKFIVFLIAIIGILLCSCNETDSNTSKFCGQWVFDSLTYKSEDITYFKDFDLRIDLKKNGKCYIRFEEKMKSQMKDFNFSSQWSDNSTAEKDSITIDGLNVDIDNGKIVVIFNNIRYYLRKITADEKKVNISNENDSSEHLERWKSHASGLEDYLIHEEKLKEDYKNYNFPIDGTYGMPSEEDLLKAYEKEWIKNEPFDLSDYYENDIAPW